MPVQEQDTSDSFSYNNDSEGTIQCLSQNSADFASCLLQLVSQPGLLDAVALLLMHPTNLLLLLERLPQKLAQQPVVLAQKYLKVAKNLKKKSPAVKRTETRSLVEA